MWMATATSLRNISGHSIEFRDLVLSLDALPLLLELADSCELVMFFKTCSYFYVVGLDICVDNDKGHVSYICCSCKVSVSSVNCKNNVCRDYNLCNDCFSGQIVVSDYQNEHQNEDNSEDFSLVKKVSFVKMVLNMMTAMMIKCISMKFAVIV